MMTTTKTNPREALKELSLDIAELALNSQLSVLSIHELRQLSGLDQETVDAGLLQASKEDIITLYEHDYPPGLSEELRASLLWDDKGRAFNAFIIRQR